MSEICVIGGGIAGLSCAAELAEEHEVTLIEREDQLCYHSTGRSAAVYIEPYLEELICRLTQLSRPHLESPRRWGSTQNMLGPRGDLRLAHPDEEAELDEYLATWSELCPTMTRISDEELRRRLPGLEATHEYLAVWNPDAYDIEVHGLSECYRKAFVARGGTLLSGCELHEARLDGEHWEIHTSTGIHRSERIVNAAGAWADTLAERCGVAPRGITPKRRTMVQVPLWSEELRRWPMVHDSASSWYLKVDGPGLLISPSDQTPSPAVDAHPEEIDVAIAVDRVEQAFGVRIERIMSRWAGLRSFSPDNLPVIGPAPDNERFIWCAGQGGFGIQTSPAFAILTRHSVSGAALPSEFEEAGIELAQLSPARFQ